MSAVLERKKIPLSEEATKISAALITRLIHLVTLVENIGGLTVAREKCHLE